ncbi:MAG: Txe/YoeB family addiction module toxin [Defluviitaleaceae bacterium]|nr:Txe/YoeB family addiction module toxin [Defluviitaleaceae bacterium]
MYDVKFTKIAAKDYDLLEKVGLHKKRDELLDIVEQDPFQYPPDYEIMKGDKKGVYSRRINRKHRFVYEVLPNVDGVKDENAQPYEGIVKVLAMWTHYERL